MARKAVNTNRQGANFELMIMADLERHGYLVHRSSGSRGAVDVMAVGEQYTLVVQAKISKATIAPAERAAVLDLAGRMGPTAVPLTATRVKGAPAYRLLTGPGPKDWMPWEPTTTRHAICAREGCEHTHGWHGADGCWDVNNPSSGLCSCHCSGFQLRAPGHKG